MNEIETLNERQRLSLRKRIALGLAVLLVGLLRIELAYRAMVHGEAETRSSDPVAALN